MTIFNIYSSQLGEAQFHAIAKAIGATGDQTVVGSSQIVPLLVSALARKTRSAAGAQALADQLDRDHDGSILAKLPGLYANPAIGHGDALTTGILGNHRAEAEAWISKESGLTAAATAKLFQITTPILLGMIGLRKRQGKFSAEVIAQTLDGFAQLHEREDQEEATAPAPLAASSGGGLGGFFGNLPGLGALGNLGSLGGILKGGNFAGVGKMITGLLDKNKDGSVMDDLQGMAGGFMGGKK
jgi:hypothetical protein